MGKVSRKALVAIAASVNSIATGLGVEKKNSSSAEVTLRRQVKPGEGNAPSKVTLKKMYDDKWAEKQIESFTEWINFTFAQNGSKPEEDEAGGENNSSAALGLRLLMQRRKEAHIRQCAMLIFHSSEVTVPLFALGEEICEGRLVVREDRDVHADLGLQETLGGLLFSYQLPWLRLGLEVVFGQIISLRSSSGDIPCTTGSARWKKQLKTFIFENLFADADIQSKYPKEKLLYKANQIAMKDQLRAHLVKKFLALVLVIDNAREQRLLSLPMMFVQKSLVKASKEVLLSFCKEFLRGEGDFIRHLGLMGYNVMFEQSYTDEYDYTVSNLAVDLRDGVRLTRLVEVLMKSSDLSSQLRVPAGSYLQKVHNVKLALSQIYKTGPAPDSKQIVEGNRDTTLLLLWKLMYDFELKMLIDPARVRKEAATIRHNQRWRRSVYGRAEAENFAVAVPMYDENGGVTYPDPADAEQDSKGEDDTDLESALLVWCNAVAGQYGVSVYNLTSCLADGRALCMLVHYYHPSILPTKTIKKTTQNIAAHFASNTSLDVYTESCVDASKSDVQRAVVNERKNFATLKKACSDIGGVPTMLPSYDSSNLPEAKTMTIFLGYLFARLIESSEQVRAAIRIQRTYRRCAEALRRSFVPKVAKKAPVRKTAHHLNLETQGVTDVCVTVVMSTHHAANVIKRLVQSFCQRRTYIRLLAERAAVQAYNQKQAEMYERMQQEEIYRREVEVQEVAENEARLLEQEALLAQQEEERQREIEHEQYLLKHEQAERMRLMEMHEETALLAMEEAAAARADAEAAEERRKLALEEAEDARADAEAAEALRQEALEEAENARAEAEAEAEAREVLVKQLGLYEEQKCVAEEQARLLEAYRLDLEKQVSEGSMTEADLRMQLEIAKSAKISAEAEAQANYEERLEILAKVAEEREAAAKAAEAEAARIAQEKLEGVIKSEKDAREAAELEARIKAEYSHSLELRIKELEETRVAELAAAADAERIRVENEKRSSQELALRVEEARVAAEDLAHRKVEEEAQIAAAAVQAEREARAAAEAQAKAEAAARMAAEAQLRAIEESRLAAQLEAQRLAEKERVLAIARTVASIRIQTVWRQFLAAKMHLFQFNICASIIQAVWRQWRMRTMWVKYNQAATTMQCEWRSFKLRRKFAVIKRSIAILVRWWKTESTRLSLKKSMHDAIRIAVRTASAEAAKEKHIALQCSSAKSITKWFRARLLWVRVRRLCNGFKRLQVRLTSPWSRHDIHSNGVSAIFPLLAPVAQAFYRAICIRRKSSAAIKTAAARIAEAEKRSIVEPSLRLGMQTKYSLETLQSGKMISHLLKACQMLELSTQVSVRCCQAFTDAQASSILFGLIRSCNRSTPHQEILRHALVVLLNVARHTHLASFVAQSPESTDVLVDLMQMFRDKQPIFSLSCELLGRLAAASEVTKVRT